MQMDGGVEPPPKRVKVHSSPPNDDSQLYHPSVASTGNVNLNDETGKEAQVGIISFVDQDKVSLNAVLKKRYTDFLVNEISLSGEVLHLKSTEARIPQAGRESDNLTTLRQSRATESIQTPGQESKRNERPAKKSQKPEHADVVTADGATQSESETRPVPEVSDEHRQKLISYLNETAVIELLKLHESIIRHPHKKSRDHPIVRTEFTSDRSLRSEIHQFIRQVFNSQIESSTDQDGILVLRASSPNNRGNRQRQQRNNEPKDQKQWRPGKLGWQERGGEYVHFTLYKENKDTMEAIAWLTRQLKCNAKTFQFAGTKDRRAVTVQRCSAYRIDAERLAAQNRALKNSVIGDFEYKTQGLELGDLQGNEFIITLRDCNLLGMDSLSVEQRVAQVQQATVSSMESLRVNGFLNYFGQQRFGTFSLRTDTIGVHILKEDFRAACDAILHFSAEALAAAQADGKADGINETAIGQDDRNRAMAIHKWRTDGSLNSALDLMPRKFSGESQLMRHLQKNPTDFYGGLMMIQRNLRLMYVHAYQSLVWNMAATQRWKLYGSKVVKGDLVLVSEHKDKENDFVAESHADVDADGEVIIQPEGDDRANQVEDIFERARVLTAEEADSGLYNIFDIVLPLPGFDVLYPENESGEFYKTFMGSEAGGHLDPYNMRRKQRDFSLSGGYRKVLARIGPSHSCSFHSYTQDDGQFVKTDLDRIKQASKKANGDANGEGNGQVKPEGDKVAVVLKFQLGTSQYATIALRELSKGGITAHKSDYSGGR